MASSSGSSPTSFAENRPIAAVHKPLLPGIGKGLLQLPMLFIILYCDDGWSRLASRTVSRVPRY